MARVATHFPLSEALHVFWSVWGWDALEWIYTAEGSTSQKDTEVVPASLWWMVSTTSGENSIVRDRTLSYRKLVPTRADIDLLIWESIMTRCVSESSISEHRSARHKLVPTQRFQFASALNGLSLHFATNSCSFCWDLEKFFLGVGKVLRWVSVRYQIPLAEIALSRRAPLKTTDLC